MSPRIEGEPGGELQAVRVHLTPREVEELRLELNYWADEAPTGPEWSTEVADQDGRRFTLVVSEPPRTG